MFAARRGECLWLERFALRDERSQADQGAFRRRRCYGPRNSGGPSIGTPATTTGSACGDGIADRRGRLIWGLSFGTSNGGHATGDRAMEFAAAAAGRAGTGLARPD
jgi:hypothetical protein